LGGQFHRITQFVTDAEYGTFKGPYVSLNLPFVKVTDDELIPLQKNTIVQI